jgi:hypothetical protein
MGSSLTKGTVRVQVRKDTASNWTTANSVLASGEFGFETDTGYLKCGDGVTNWGSLKYVGSTKIVDGDGTNFHTNIGSTWTLTEGAGIVINHTDTGSPTYATTITANVTGERVNSELIAGGNATDGHVLTADGSGAAAWEASAGGGGTSYWTPVWGNKFYTRYLNWFGAGSSTSGGSYFNWYLSFYPAAETLPTFTYDTWNPIIVVPKACTLTSYYAQGNFTSTQTYELALMKGVKSGDWNTNGNYLLTQIGSTQSLAATSGYAVRMGETGLSVSLAEGETLVPCLRRTTADTSSYYYFENNFYIIAEYT